MHFPRVAPEYSGSTGQDNIGAVDANDVTAALRKSSAQRRA